MSRHDFNAYLAGHDFISFVSGHDFNAYLAGCDFISFVSGHDFSRAANQAKWTRALAPEGIHPSK
jgi:hypothetical protein